MGKLTHTHTFAELEVSAATYDEVAAKLREADYDHLQPVPSPAAAETE